MIDAVKPKKKEAASLTEAELIEAALAKIAEHPDVCPDRIKKAKAKLASGQLLSDEALDSLADAIIEIDRLFKDEE